MIIKRERMKRVEKILRSILGAICIIVLLRGFVITSFLIPSSGMENSLYQGERILVNKWSYGLRLPFMKIGGYQRWAEKEVKKNDIIVFNNPANYQTTVIDQREVFIGRCVGLPGDTLLMDSLFCIIPTEQESPDQKHLYVYPTSREKDMIKLLSRLNMHVDAPLAKDSIRNIRSFSRYEYYLITQAMKEDKWIAPLSQQDRLQDKKVLTIPRKGITVRIEPWSSILLRNTLVLHEGVEAEVKNGILFINGKPTENYCFSKDYYWVSSDNSTNLHDSRLFGFVPKDHIIGKASLIWFSKESGRKWHEGYRWERIGMSIR